MKASDPGQRCAARAPDPDSRPKRGSSCEGADSSAFSIRRNINKRIPRLQLDTYTCFRSHSSCSIVDLLWSQSPCLSFSSTVVLHILFFLAAQIRCQNPLHTKFRLVVLVDEYLILGKLQIDHCVTAARQTKTLLLSVRSRQSWASG